MLKKRNLGIIDWLIVFLLLSIPIVNIVCIIIWLLDSKVNQTFKNMIIAFLIVWIIFGGAIWFK